MPLRMTGLSHRNPASAQRQHKEGLPLFIEMKRFYEENMSRRIKHTFYARYFFLLHKAICKIVTQ
jgi:hypothetical protein